MAVSMLRLSCISASSLHSVRIAAASYHSDSCPGLASRARYARTMLLPIRTSENAVYAISAESPKGEVRRILIPRTSVNRDAASGTPPNGIRALRHPQLASGSIGQGLGLGVLRSVGHDSAFESFRLLL